MKIFKKAKRGFTLVELVVVIAVIAILAAVSVGAYFGVTESANNSRLEQETKQLHTAIQTISLGTNSNQTLDKNGLVINDEQTFNDALDATIGTDYDVFLGQTPNTVSKPTVVFKTDEFVKETNGGGIVYKSFEYYQPQVGGKYVVADVVTGELNIKSSNVKVDTNADMRTLYYVDHPSFTSENPYIYMWDSENKPAVAWPGEQSLTLVNTYETYEENEVVNVFKFTVDVNKYTSFVINKGDGQPQTVNCSYDKTSSNNTFVATGLTNNEGYYVVENHKYIANEWNYGRFTAPGEEVPLNKYYIVDHPGFKESTSELYVHIFNAENSAALTTWPGMKVEAKETLNADTNGNLNIYEIELDRALYDTIVVSSVDESKLDENSGVVWQTVNLSLADLDSTNNNLYAITQRYTNEYHYIAVKGTYAEGTWNYNQFVTETVNKTYYFLDQKFFQTETLNVYPYSSTTYEVQASWPGYEFSGNPTVINTSDYGELNLYSVTINSALYDRVVFSNGTNQTVNIDLSAATVAGHNLFALSDEVDNENHFEVVSASRDGANWNYGQVMRVVPVETDMRTYYFDGAPWESDGAAIYYFTKFEGTDVGAAWPGTKVSSEKYYNSIYKVEVDANLVDTLIFTRRDPSNGGDWGGQTVDIGISDVASGSLFTLKEEKVATNMEVEISTYTPTALTSYSVYLAGSLNGWSTNNEAYKFTALENNLTLTTLIPENTEYKVYFTELNKWIGDASGSNITIADSGEYTFTITDTEITANRIGDFVCTHTGHYDAETGVCDWCGHTCTHDEYNNSVCTECGHTCNHDEYNNSVCTECGYECKHGSYNGGLCTECGTACSHTYVDGTCTICGDGCNHTWSNGVCTKCNHVCTHSLNGGVCTNCKFVSEDYLFFKTSNTWSANNPRYAAYFFGNGEKWVSMTDENEDGIYEVLVPEGYPNVIFCRMNPSAAANNWNNKWNQTGDLTIPTSGNNNLYTVKEGTWDKGGGAWSVYQPE